MVIVDIGTGDGSFAYHMAKENPQSLVIGIDPCHENLVEISAKALKKLSKGGLANVLYVLSSVETLPRELNGSADKVYINFPWGTLLQGIVLAHELTWNNIKKICKTEALVHVIFGYDPEHDKKEIERLNLPILNEACLQNSMIPKLENLGFSVMNVKSLTYNDLREYPSTWAKKLSYGSHRTFYSVILQKSEKLLDS